MFMQYSSLWAGKGLRTATKNTVDQEERQGQEARTYNTEGDQERSVRNQSG